MACDVPAGTLIGDLRGFVNNEMLSDICFVVEGMPVYAHKILCMRCTYFRAMLMGEMRESRARDRAAGREAPHLLGAARVLVH